MAVSWRKAVFQKMGCWNPYFYSVFWVRVFWAKLSKKGNLNTRQKWLITESCFFGIFVFFFFLFFVVVFFLFFVFFGGSTDFGPPHLTLNPPYLFFSVVVVFCFLWFFFGGFCKGQVRWPLGHLTGTKPSLFSFCFVLFFLSFLCF